MQVHSFEFWFLFGWLTLRTEEQSQLQLIEREDIDDEEDLFESIDKCTRNQYIFIIFSFYTNESISYWMCILWWRRAGALFETLDHRVFSLMIYDSLLSPFITSLLSSSYMDYRCYSESYWSLCLFRRKSSTVSWCWFLHRSRYYNLNFRRV